MSARRRWVGGIALAVLLVLVLWAAYRPTPTPSGGAPPSSPATAPPPTYGIDDAEESPGPLKHVDCNKWKGHPDVFAAGGTCWKMIEVSPTPAPTATSAE